MRTNTTATSAGRGHTAEPGAREGQPPEAAQAEPWVGDPSILADQIAAAAADCPGVARLAAGPLATYLPGRTVPGVAVREDAVTVAVVAEYGPPLVEVAQQVRDAVGRVTPDRRIDVSVDDINLPAGARGGPGGAGSRGGS
jgi:hypothetical protein